MSALQADYRLIAGYAEVTAPGREFRAFSLVMLWTLSIVMLSKAFSLLDCSTMSRQRPGTELQKKKK